MTDRLLPRAAALAAAAVVAAAGLAMPAQVGAAGSLDLRATYDAAAVIDYAGGRMSVDSTASVSNPGSAAVHRLVFNLVPLRIGDAVVEAVTVNGLAATHDADDQSLTVVLPTALVAGGQAQVRVRYSADLSPSPADGHGYFRKVDGIIVAARWIPWLSRPVEFDRPTIGNPFVTASAAQVDVTLTSERSLVYATSGQRVGVSADGLTQTFVAHNVRDFNFAAAPDYQQASTQVGGKTITLYYRDLPAERVLELAERAFAYYADMVGDYSWPALTIGESVTPKALESPALVWIPASTRGARVTYLVSHEIAHEWFYGAVGSDQAAEPFADEALAEFLTRTVTGTMRASRCPDDTLDRSIYEYTDACYFETVYVQGALYLDAYRRDVGDAAFWRGVRDYYAAFRFGMGGTRQLLDALDAASGRDGARHAARFPRLYPDDPTPSGGPTPTVGPSPNPESLTFGAVARLWWFGVIVE